VELRQLVYFDAVVREGGFTRAARQLHVAQPAISAQIKQLETELGVVLLERQVRPPALTHAGRVFHARARLVLAQIEAARSEMLELSAVVRGKVRVGATPVLGSLDLAAAMASFRRRHPGVGLTMRSGLVDELVAQLDAGDLDVVIGPEHEGLRAGHRVRPLADEFLVLAVPSDHPLGISSRVHLSDCRGEPFICLPPGSGMHSLLLQACAMAGFAPRIDFEADNPQSIRELVAAGLGIALMAASTTSGPGAPVRACELVFAPKHPPIAIITAQRDPAPAAAGFVAHLQESALATG
jgi:LysR family transcriptional activator of glutamate synthase operon